MDKRVLIVRSFLYSVLDGILKRGVPNLKQEGFIEEGFPHEKNIKKILYAPTDQLWTALGAVLSYEQKRELSIIIDGLDKVEHQKDEFIRGVRAFIEYLQKRVSMVKALLISRPQAEIKDLFRGLPCIEYDKERKGSATPYVLTLN
jgi:ankyrin repeat domain-containing protein 50